MYFEPKNDFAHVMVWCLLLYVSYVMVLNSSDTERLYTIATQRVCDEFGKTYTWDVKKQLMGSTETESAKKIIGKLARADWNSLVFLFCLMLMKNIASRFKIEKNYTEA